MQVHQREAFHIALLKTKYVFEKLYTTIDLTYSKEREKIREMLQKWRMFWNYDNIHFDDSVGS